MASKSERAKAKRDALDASYRKSLGVPENGSLPNKIGNTTSAGAARGGRGASQRGRGRWK